jgi:hypothetical protein
MTSKKLPFDIDSELRELGVLPASELDEIDAEDLHQNMAGKRVFNADYNMPHIVDGEPDF